MQNGLQRLGIRLIYSGSMFGVTDMINKRLFHFKS